MNLPIAELYKRLIECRYLNTAKLLVERRGSVGVDGWIYFDDGSRFNTANNQTINPGDIIV